MMRNSSSERLSGMSLCGRVALRLGFSDCRQRIGFEPRQTKPQQPLQQLGALARGAWITEGLAQGTEISVAGRALPRHQIEHDDLAVIGAGFPYIGPVLVCGKPVIDTLALPWAFLPHGLDGERESGLVDFVHRVLPP